MPDWGTLVGAIGDIIDKCTPGRLEAYKDELNILLFNYKKALDMGMDTEAAILNKRMVEIRRKVALLS